MPGRIWRGALDNCSIGSRLLLPPRQTKPQPYEKIVRLLLMPLFALCRHPGCGCRIPYGERFCEKHKTDAAKRYEPARKRLTASQRGYTSRWRRISQEFLKAHPLCAECERNGRVTPAACVDHIKPHKGDPALFWDQRNWQPLCHVCHSRKTAAEDGGFGNRMK